MHSEELGELFNGLMLFRSQLQQPEKDGNNPFFKKGYVTLEGVIKSVDDALKGTGLSYSQVVQNDENGNTGVKTILTHKSGQYFETGVLALVPEKKNPQGYGSAITYAKRYQLSALFGVSSDKDDDGNKATPSNKPSYQQQAPRQQAKPKQQTSEQDQTTINNMNKLTKGKVEKMAEKLGVKQSAIQEAVKKSATESLKGKAATPKAKAAAYLQATEAYEKKYINTNSKQQFEEVEK